MKKLYALAFLCLVMALCPWHTPAYAQATRTGTPDGEAVIRKFVFSYNSALYRLATTTASVYATKSLATGSWDKNAELLMVPPGQKIVDIAAQAGESGAQRHFSLLIDNGSVLTFVFNTATMALAGTPTVIAPPPGNIANLRRIINDNTIYALINTKVWVNNSGVWTLDTAGAGTSTFTDIALETGGNIIASTTKGAYQLNTTSGQWTRIASLDTLNYNAVFINKGGNYFISTTSRGTFKSTDQAASWTIDSAGIGMTRIDRFGDDLLGRTFAIIGATTTSALYSQDAGSGTWVRIDSMLNLAVGAASRIYDVGGEVEMEAATTYGIYTSTDFGSSWTPSFSGIMSEDIYGMQFLASGKTVASTSFGIYVKDSPSSNWVKRFPTSGYSSGKILRKDAAGNLYTQEASGGGAQPRVPNILKSIDQGSTWSYDTLGISSIPSATNPTYFVATDGRQFYGLNAAGNAPVRVYSKAEGDKWALDTVGLDHSRAQGNAQKLCLGFGFDGNKIFTSIATLTNNIPTAASVYSRLGEAASWALDTNGLNNGAVSAFQANATGKMTAGTLAGGKVASISQMNAATWTPIPVPAAATTDIHYLAFNSSNNLYAAFAPVIAGSYRGVYLTGDLGATWNYAGLDSVTVRGLTPKTAEMYAFSNRGAYLLGSATIKAPIMTLGAHAIDFGLVDTKSYSDKIVNISNTGDDTLRVTNITTNNTDFIAQALKFNVAPGANYDLTIRFTPKAIGDTSGTLKIVSNTFPDSLKVNGTGFSSTAPVMVLSSRAIMFGNVESGKSKDTTLIIGNSGTDTLKITRIRLLSTIYTVSKTTDSIAPGGSDTLTITFSPTDTVAYTAVLRITSNLPADSVVLGGQGFVYPDAVADLTPDAAFELKIVPNTFTTMTNFHITLPNDGLMVIKLYDELGNELGTIANDVYQAGEYEWHFDAGTKPIGGLENGLYYVRVSTSKFMQTKPLIIMK